MQHGRCRCVDECGPPARFDQLHPKPMDGSVIPFAEAALNPEAETALHPAQFSPEMRLQSYVDAARKQQCWMLARCINTT